MYSLKNTVDTSKIFQNFVEKIEFSLKSDKNNGYLHEDGHTFFITSHSVLLRLIQIQIVEKIKTHILCSVTHPPPKKIMLFMIVWKNIVEWGRPQITIWCMCIACWIPTSRNTLRTCNSYCFSTVTMVPQMYLTVVIQGDAKRTHFFLNW